MADDWNDNTPIYKQLEAHLISWILKGTYKEGESLPSVRKLSVEFQINHLTVAKSFQDLVDQEIIEKRRGLGMFVKDGALQRLQNLEKSKFFDQELPNLLKRIKELNIEKEELYQAIYKTESEQ